MTQITRRQLLAAAAMSPFALSTHARADTPATFTNDEIVDNGHRFFGSLSRGLAEADPGGGAPVGAAERLYPGPGGLRRVRRRPALRRRPDVHPQRRRPGQSSGRVPLSVSMRAPTATGR